MKKFRVYSRHINGYEAPYMIVEALEEKQAIKATRLSDFDCWNVWAVPFFKTA